ncbi:pectate lyase [Granulicella sp. 5B5]|uniref:pectate lyase n=1 Tax=Granulicella sp. 5B5 TaxID=1617967 RepID=UPI0015F6F6EF|nr:pectate lyase [Granulicella sp. 5B5]QMV19016.1 pectate lyase [Granulicella sp. 5B5]
MRALMLSLAVVLVPGFLSMGAVVVGKNVPVVPLTEARIRAEVTKGEQRAWIEYLHRSAEQMAADKAALAKERVGMVEVPGLPKQGFSGRAMRLQGGDAFYKSDEARRTGDIIVSFQTPAGGWSKNLAMDEPRLKGQSYTTGNLAPVAEQPGDFDQPKDPNWHYVGTLDNDATNTELRFLAEMSAAWPGHEGDKYRAAALRGYEYLLRSQYPNGGWPQVWPLEGGYHDAITFNDGAVIESLETLTKVADGVKVVTAPSEEEIQFARLRTYPGGQKMELPEASTEDYTFVPAALGARARAAVAKGLALVLRAQIRVPSMEGKGTVLAVWAQQYDPLTLEACSARNYEMPALSSGESADAMAYLMSLDHPSRAVVRSVDAAAAWFEAHKIMGYEFVGGRNTPGGRHLEKKDGAGPLWARYYSLTTGKPIFGDRDKSIHDDVMEISLERRNGYAWYSGGEEKALEEYGAWRRRQ